MDNNTSMKKNVLMALVIVMIGLGIVGGTYAYLTLTATVTNEVYNVSTHCSTSE